MRRSSTKTPSAATMTRSRSRRSLFGISALAAIWLAAAAIASSGIGHDLLWLIFTFYSGIAILVAWLVAVVIFRKAQPSPRLAAVAPLLLALGTLLSQLPQSSNPVFRVRFFASRPSLARIAEAAPASEPTASRRRIGLFVVDRVQVAQGQVEFVVYCGLFSTCGIAYVPPGRPADLQGANARSLGGPWYHFRRSW